MMQKPLCPMLALVCGVVGFVLRLWQNATGFEIETGLALQGALSGWAVPVGLVLLLGGVAFAVCRLPQESAGSFSFEDRGTMPAALLAVTGIVLAGGAGVMRVLGAMAQQSQGELLIGATMVVSVVALLPAAAACKRGSMVRGVFLLVPVACYVLQLVLVYRENSIDPVLASYYVEILALSALVMAYYRLCAFGYGCGTTRTFVYWATVAIALCLMVLADFLPVRGAFNLCALGFYGGAAMTLLGLLLSRLRNRGPSAPPKLPRRILQAAK